jgi:hypothetical protein
MKPKVMVITTTVAVAILVGAWSVAVRSASSPVIARPASVRSAEPAAPVALSPVDARRRADFAAMEAFRPGYSFWQYVFTLHDGAIAFGSGTDGHLLVTFPKKGDWSRHAVWSDPALASVLDGQVLARNVSKRREQVAALLEQAAGPVLNNATRGDALQFNARRYGPFLSEWGAIYDRFGVPADIGLAQVIFESGMNATKRSEANAVGFCQWLQKNWKRLNGFSPFPIEGRNQTTQAPYCAAYLSILATKYGSFIPALSEHNAGGTNVGRTLINGEYLGGDDVRAQYFLGSQLARDLRALPGKTYNGVYRTYGPRSYLYAEMVFGNSYNVRKLIAMLPQESIYAMRPTRALSLEEITSQTGLSVDAVRRFNPALADRVPPGSMLYLPTYVADFGPDVAFWHRPASAAYAAVLDAFVHLAPGPERWDDPSFAPILSDFRRRFRETGTEEGQVMDTVLAYVMDQAYTSGRRELLVEFRRNDRVRQLIDSGLVELRRTGRGTS